MDNKKALMPNRRYDITLYNPPDCGGSAGDEYGYIYSCPNCKRDFDEAHTSNFCDKCGQEIGWNRRPDNWIPVSEKMPRAYHAVLVYCPECMNAYCASLNADGQWLYFAQGVSRIVGERVTHWMPLPEPPKEVK